MMQGFTATSAGEGARVENYEILHTIGEGTCAKVKLARHILTRTEVVVKIIQKRGLRSSGTQNPSREVDCMRALDHPNIVKLLEVIDTEETLCLVMEYLSGGDMFSHLEHHGRMTEAEARGPFRQLVSALQHCHQRGIVHRDLKPENLLLDAHMNVKITDFGLSNKCEAGGMLHTFCGTLGYAAPEMFLGKSYDGPAVDVWSLGVVLYVTVTGHLPFAGQSFGELQQQVLQGQYCIPFYLSSAIRNLFKKMIVVNPSERGDAADLLRHPWVNMGQEEPLRPACEENPGVPVAKTLGSRREQLQVSRKGSESSDKPEVGGCTTTVSTMRPCFSTELTSCDVEPPPSPEVSTLISTPAGEEKVLLPKEQESGQKNSKPASPPPSLEERTATPSPVTQSGPGAASSTSSPGSKTGAPEGSRCPPGVANTGSSSRAGQPESVSPATSSGHSKKQKKGVAWRIWNCIVKHLCFRLLRRKRSNKMKPM